MEVTDQEHNLFCVDFLDDFFTFISPAPFAVRAHFLSTSILTTINLGLSSFSARGLVLLQGHVNSVLHQTLNLLPAHPELATSPPRVFGPVAPPFHPPPSPFPDASPFFNRPVRLFRGDAWELWAELMTCRDSLLGSEV
jgi:hypothetical protein